MRFGWLVVSALLAIFLCIGQGLANAAPKVFGPFSVDDRPEPTIVLNGEIDLGSALNFRRALDAAPGATMMVLNSPGGLVQAALLIADDVHKRGLATYIPDGARCYSACSLIFFAGRERRADGELGVHQISAPTPDLESAQVTISDIIELLNRFGTPTEVLTAMFRTSAGRMHVFSRAEVERFINRGPGQTGGDGRDVTGLPEVGEGTVLPRGSFSEFDHRVSQPVKLAVYAGLDFYGADIATLTTGEAAECAKRCLERADACRAFTYNVSERARRGPNCFLKSERGQLDGNADALSGLVLTRGQSVPDTFRVGVIDPKEGTFDDVDLPGGDLTPTPHRVAGTAAQCRLACVQNDACRAYTFIRAKQQCWLKGRAGTPRYASGMVSGLKRVADFKPANVFELE